MKKLKLTNLFGLNLFHIEIVSDVLSKKCVKKKNILYLVINFLLIKIYFTSNRLKIFKKKKKKIEYYSQIYLQNKYRLLFFFVDIFLYLKSINIHKYLT